MNKSFYFIIKAFCVISVVLTGTKTHAQQFRHIPYNKKTETAAENITGLSLPVEKNTDSIINRPRSLEDIIASIPLSEPRSGGYLALRSPRIFYSFRHLQSKEFKTEPLRFEAAFPITCIMPDSVFIAPEDTMPATQLYPVMSSDVLPSWLTENIRSRNMMSELIYTRMIEDPSFIEYKYWALPEPPKLPEDDPSFFAYLKKLDLPVPEQKKEEFQLHDIEKRHWLHIFKSGIQFSQAYISPNWYQGGNNHLALLVDLLWDVSLNQVYHPNLMFHNTVSYKLGLNSTPQDKYHKYAISEDLFQWNLRFGIKAFKKWFYSFTTQFKTQFLNNYPQDSKVRTASFLSPGDLNIGLGMTYSTTNKNKNLKFNASIAPVSYNLKTCIDRNVDPTQFNIAVGKRFQNEIGSNAELTMEWKWAKNITYKSRLFLFSNYKYFQGDWENTISFNINRFLSTQIYIHARYDTSTEISNQKWKHFMLKEILSFGFAYAFSTK